MPTCIIPNCQAIGDNNISIRCRRADTTAIWAPNTNAYLCDTHADEGYQIEITLTSVPRREVITLVSANGGAPISRTTPIINHP